MEWIEDLRHHNGFRLVVAYAESLKRRAIEEILKINPNNPNAFHDFIRLQTAAKIYAGTRYVPDEILHELSKEEGDTSEEDEEGGDFPEDDSGI